MNENKYGCKIPVSFHRVDIEDADLLKKFKCNDNKVIEAFIREKSIDSKSDVSYIFVDDSQNTIMGFCSLCCTGINVSDYDNDGNLYVTAIPSVEITYFAVDEDYRNLKLDEDSTRYETLSKYFFGYMLNIIRGIATDVVGATHVCLYAVPQAVNFYKRCGMCEFDGYMLRDELPFTKPCIPMFCVIDD